MPAERFYLNADFVKGASVCLTGTEHHHLSHVMRLRPGEEVELVNGRGGLSVARIADADKQLTTLDILSLSKTPPSPVALIAAVPLMRPSKLEWVLEKGTELGADAFCLYRADHSEKDTLSEHQIDRLRNVTISAMKQSGRLYLPPLEVLPHLESIFEREGQFLFGDIRPNALPLVGALDPTIIFITGPEQGFSEGELHLLDQKARGVRINPNILRAETAPIAAMSILKRSL
jgi:16S rRNA (uracil1498-N3)-methyltransferase